MAVQEQIEILKQGPAVWNAWRRDNKVPIDLSGVTLHDTRAPWRNEDLTQIGLEGVNLRSANLENTTLRGANMRRADLYSVRPREKLPVIHKKSAFCGSIFLLNVEY